MPKPHLSESAILHKLMPDAHEGNAVQASVRANARRTGEKVAKPKKREQAMAEHILRMSNLFESDRQQTRERAYEAAVDKLLIKPDDIPESYWKQQQQIARDNGEGDIEFDAIDKADRIEELRGAQRTGAESWANYLEQTGNQYPTWFKIYAWDGMSRMGKFNKSKGLFDERDKTTVAPYPQLNPAALAKVHSILHKHLAEEQATIARIKQLNKKQQIASQKMHRSGEINRMPGQFLNEDEQRELAELKSRPRVVTGKDFNNLYSSMLIDQKAIIPPPENPEDVKGQWHVYTSDDIERITNAAEGTPWCIAGEAAAESYTKYGEFHLFHLIDPETGKESPTACASVRMAHGAVAEISGLKGDNNQYLEDSLVPTVEAKIKTLPGGENYLRKFADKQKLIAMDRKFIAGEEFTVEELEFLYELDNKIEYFDTYNPDPRPAQFRNEREAQNEKILNEKYSSIDVHALMHEASGSLVSIDSLMKEGASGPVLLSRIRQGNIPENIDALLLAGNSIDAIVSHMYGASIIKNLERLDALGAEIDIDAAVAESDAVTIAANLPKLQERGVHLDMNEFNDRVGSYVRMKYIGNLLDAGANIDLDTVVQENDAKNAVENLDEVARVGAAFDATKLVWDLHDTGDVSRNIGVLLRHGADPDMILKRFMMRDTVMAVANIQTLADAGAKIDIEQIVSLLEPFEKAQYLSELRQFGAKIDLDKLVQDLGASTVSYMSHLQEAGAKLNVDDLIKNAPNASSLVINMEILLKSGADINVIMERLAGMRDNKTSGIQGRATIGKLLKLGADREKMKQVLSLTDEKIDGIEDEANEIVARLRDEITQRAGIGRYRQ